MTKLQSRDLQTTSEMNKDISSNKVLEKHVEEASLAITWVIQLDSLQQ
jgi:hypothetical protein